MTSSIRQDESDEWTAQFFREIEDWFREQYGCVGQSEAARAARRGVEQPLAAKEHCLGMHAEAEQAIRSFRPY